MDVSKTKSSFYRRLYVAYLIDSQTGQQCAGVDRGDRHAPAHGPGHPSRRWPTWISCVSSSRKTGRAIMPGITGFATGGRLIGVDRKHLGSVQQVLGYP